MEATLRVPAGIRSVMVILADGRIIRDFITRKESSFLPTDKVDSDKGTVAFLKDGAKLVVQTNAVRIAFEVEEAVHEGLRLLAGTCNGARSWDGAGFNKLDTVMGKSLANSSRLSTAQVFVGARLVRKYRGQLESAGQEHLVTLASSILPPIGTRKVKETVVEDTDSIL